MLNDQNKPRIWIIATRIITKSYRNDYQTSTILINCFSYHQS